jgi:hypothetical protein
MFDNRPSTAFRVLVYALSVALVIGVHIAVTERAATMLA